MVGIYKITNNINGHCYIGQSRNITKRWSDEKTNAFNPIEKSYDYPLSRAFRKYGIQNFTFEVIEECSVEDLNEKENYWIHYHSPVYNQTAGGDYQAHGKLSQKEVEEIQQILVQDIEGKVRHIELAKKYSVSADTIQAINCGRAWINSSLTYPLHLSKFDSRREKQTFYCIDCGVVISKNCSRCEKCSRVFNHEQALKNKPITREELKKRIREEPFVTIAKDFGVTDNAIRKWCKTFQLPFTKKDIKKYSDEEWFFV